MSYVSYHVSYDVWCPMMCRMMSSFMCVTMRSAEASNYNNTRNIDRLDRKIFKIL